MVDGRRREPTTPKPEPKPRKFGKSKMTKRQSTLARLRVANPDATLEELGKRAGYKKKPLRVAAARALKSPLVVKKITELMDLHPNLTDKGLARKLSEGVEASKTEFFQYERVVGEEPVLDAKGDVVKDKNGKPVTREVKDLDIITRECIDYSVRHKYVETALKVKKHLTTGLDIAGAAGDGVISFTLSLGDRGAGPAQPSADGAK